MIFVRKIFIAFIFRIRQLQELSKRNGYVESMDRHVAPKSLYLTQLKERLGESAVKNIAKPKDEPE